MKKFLSVLVAVTLSVSCFAFSVFAGTTSSEDLGSMEIKTERAEEISVSFPADTSVPWNTPGDYEVGKVSADKMVIAPDKKVVITVSSKNALNFVNDDGKIPYVLGGADAIAFTELHDSSEFPLTVNVAQADWDKAPAGEYGDILTFTLEYVNK